MKHSKYYFLLALFLSHISLVDLQAQNPVGSTAGAFEVTPSGSATYTVPIEVVPGTAGIQPNLSVFYNSMSGMGVLGMKWHLSGLSAISRTPQTFFHDHNQTVVRLDTSDRFSLDGNRLISSGSSYWFSGSGYRPEIETFDSIASYGVQGNGPQYFKVFSDNGSVIEYGNTEDSRHLLGGAVLNWISIRSRILTVIT
jgi:hypothetical protein